MPRQRCNKAKSSAFLDFAPRGAGSALPFTTIEGITGISRVITLTLGKLVGYHGHMNPTQVAANRTARLIAEASAPVFTSTVEFERTRVAAYAEVYACTEDFCFVCSRSTNHFAEHSEEQLHAWAQTPFARRLMREEDGK